MFPPPSQSHRLAGFTWASIAAAKHHWAGFPLPPKESPRMSNHRLHRSNSSPLVAWNSFSPLSRTYSVNDISTYASASDYYKQRWSTAYNPYHKSSSYYYWPQHRYSSLFPVYSTHEDTRYFYESPCYTRVPTFYPTWNYSSDANYYTYLLDTYRAVWRHGSYDYGKTYQYRTYWPWRESIRYHYRFD